MLHISDELRAILVAEFRYAASQMRNAPNPVDKAYYMSATHGVLMRLLNIKMDDELVFAHQVLQQAHQILNGRVGPARRGEVTGGMPTILFESIENDIEEIANRWEKNEEVTDLLSHISLCGYAATGNGFYLYEKGEIKLVK